VLAVISTHLPAALRVFLLTLAMVDDLLAIIIIAVVYTGRLAWSPMRPISAGLAVPIFAFFAAGVSIVDSGGLAAALSDPVALGIVAGLVAGKTIGVLGGTWLIQRTTRAELADGLSWWDVLGVAQLAGIGFTVSLLIGELAFGAGSAADDHVKIGVLSGSLLAALLATIVLRARNSYYRRLCAQEEQDRDHDGVPDVYQHDRPDTE